MLPRMSDDIRSGVENEAVRRHERRLLNTPVCLIVERTEKVLLVNACFRNVSKDGAAIFAAVELALDSEIQLEFTPPWNSGPLRVRAIVGNRRQYVYGLEFLPRDHKEEQTLLKLTAILLPAGIKDCGILDSRCWT
jgi:hypothetical protein